MIRRAGVAWAVWLTGAAVLAAQSQVFRGGVDVVSLNVTVTDADGHLVPKLDQAAFHVYEDGAQQQLTYFSRGTQPIALSLLIDTSTSMDIKLATAKDAAIGFAHRLGANDVAEVVAFNSRVQILQSFTRDAGLLDAAIKKLDAGGSTSLYNAVYTALDSLKRLRNNADDVIRRQGIVLLSDGEDTSSLVDYDTVLDAAKRSQVTIYAVGLRSPRDKPTHGAFDEAEFVLRTLSQETGGRLFLVDQIAQLPGVYQEIADEIANQYVMGYSSRNPKRDGAWRTIVVQVDSPGATARTKRGYYGPTVSR